MFSFYGLDEREGLPDGRELHRALVRGHHHGTGFHPPVLRFAEVCLRFFANFGKETPAAWWLSILIIGPLARILHHRARRDDHLRDAASQEILQA
jgi:hypothetical protein